ncbi:uncharacterized protein LOC118191047, partial [Stegodyphus dumicola]|uniref:uncharacterized protein LOC118191047 n=1 Tax=Stegodyphus dumicola TaxID=202533 RepID=UPI0015A955F2
MYRQKSLGGQQEVPPYLREFKTALVKAFPVQDLAGTSAELVYGTPLRLPSEFFQPSSAPVDPASFVQTFREAMKKLSATPTSCHNKSAPFVHHALSTCTHVFVRNDVVKPPLTPPYEGPFKVCARNNKHFTVLVRDKETVLSIGRLKSAFFEASNTQVPVTSDLPDSPDPTATATPDTPPSTDLTLSSQCSTSRHTIGKTCGASRPDICELIFFIVPL